MFRRLVVAIATWQGLWLSPAIAQSSNTYELTMIECPNTGAMAIEISGQAISLYASNETGTPVSLVAEGVYQLSANPDEHRFAYLRKENESEWILSSLLRGEAEEEVCFDITPLGELAAGYIETIGSQLDAKPSTLLAIIALAERLQLERNIQLKQAGALSDHLYLISEYEAIFEELQLLQDARDALALQLLQSKSDQDALNAVLAQVQGDRDGLSETLALTESERDKLALELLEAQSERNRLQAQLQALQNNLELTEAELSARITDSDELQAELERRIAELLAEQSASELDSEELRRQLSEALVAKLAAEQRARTGVVDLPGPYLDIVVEGEGANGTITIDLMQQLAPGHVERVMTLAQQGLYDDVVFHRVIEGFMAQTGDVEFGKLGGDLGMAGRGGSDLPDLPAEFSDEPFARGILGMARAQSPDSANSQFFIMFAPAPSLDGQYTVLGEVTEGIDVVDAIKRGDGPNGAVLGQPDRMVSVTVRTN